MFQSGISPTTSHTAGPIRPAPSSMERIEAEGLFAQVRAIKVELFGSLGFTGRGHGSDKAIILGLEGEDPSTVIVDTVDKRVAAVAQAKTVKLLGRHEVELDPDTQLV